MKNIYVSKISQALKVIFLYATSNPSAWPEFSDFTQVIVFTGADGFVTIINNFMEYKRVTIQSSLLIFGFINLKNFEKSKMMQKM